LLLPVSYDALHRPILCHIPLAQNGTPATVENRHAGQAHSSRPAGEAKSGYRPVNPATLLPGRPVSAKTSKKYIRKPLFSAEIAGAGLTFALMMVIAWN
jgi:hypothetical protein